MSALLRAFYSLMLWATQLELAIALSLPERNHANIARLKASEDDYSRALLRMELGL